MTSKLSLSGSPVIITVTNTKSGAHPPSANETSSADGQTSQHHLLDSLFEDSRNHARVFTTAWDIGHLVASVGAGYWIDLPDKRTEVRAITAWWILWDLSGIMELPGILPTYLDYEIKESRLAEHYRAVAARRASIKKEQIDMLPGDKRETVILWIFRCTHCRVAGRERPARDLSAPVRGCLAIRVVGAVAVMRGR